MECKCGEPTCINKLWIEEGRYLWVRFGDPDNYSEKQVLRFDLVGLVQLRDYINDELRESVGLGGRDG